MRLIIGGACQGKLAYAKETYPEVVWIDGRLCAEAEIYECQGVYHFHEYIRRMMQDERDVSELAEQLSEKNPDMIIVSDEIGYGIVPVDDFLREYREMTGRICTKLAARADSVCRVVCGIGTKIK